MLMYPSLMLKQMARWPTTSSHTLLPIPLVPNTTLCNILTMISTIKPQKLSTQLASSFSCSARRRVRYEEEEEEEEEEEYGHNEEVAMLELYSEYAREEALLVHADVDEQEVEVLIFKGFSSCLSYKTATDPSRSVLPARAVIKSVDRIKGPFDPSNIEYLEKGLTWEAFKSRLTQT